MNWYASDTWIVIVGALCAMACALPGCFLVLRRMSMMGDAISHAVLPGLAAGFMLTGARTSLTMFIGAAVVGILTAVFTQWVSRLGQVDRGASMGIVFTTLFALGLIMLVQATEHYHVDLDPDCVLYGAIEFAADDVWMFAMGDWVLSVPRAVVVLGAVFVINAGLIVALFKEFRISTFDPELATTLGIHAQFMHYLLMTMTAITTVAAFEIVGSIIVIAMLIVPPATAYLLTRRLWTMILLSLVVSIMVAVLGHVGAIVLPPMAGFDATNTSGMMAVASGVLFMLAWLFSIRPRKMLDAPVAQGVPPA